jgi:hypothetical protein
VHEKSDIRVHAYLYFVLHVILTHCTRIKIVNKILFLISVCESEMTIKR